MRLSEFDYTLPSDLIAQQPAHPRDASRLLVVDRAAGRLTHHVFREIVDLLDPADVLVINDTRVIPARLRGRRHSSGGAVEVLLLRPADGGAWEALVRPGRLREGSRVEIVTPASRPVTLLVGERLPDGRRLVRLAGDGDMLGVLRQAGEMPTPPYIHRPLDHPDLYQTVYAREEGAIAAPTAGLHFTPGLLQRLRAKGVEIVTLTLHVGIGTFRAIGTDDVRLHRMEAEYYTITPEAAAAINVRRGRLVAVGTTTVRALESAAGPEGAVRPGGAWTELYITPGFVFRVTEGLVTNFHLPRTTLLVLVSAFAGREVILRAYDEAIRQRYRFYSFGDAMLIR